MKLLIVFVLSLVLMPLARAEALCLREDATHIVLHRDHLFLGGIEHFYEVVVTGELATAAERRDPTDPKQKVKVHLPPAFESATVTLFDDECTRAYRQKFPEADSARVEVDRLGDRSILQFVGTEQGASGNGYWHVLASLTKRALERLTPLDFGHSNMGGFFVGPLGSDRGDGVVVWNAVWAGDESHYEPHRYQFDFYCWTDSRFLAPERVEPTQKFDAVDPNAAPRGMGWAFTDQTNDRAFPEAIDRHH